jgi:hypothetical protein
VLITCPTFLILDVIINHISFNEHLKSMRQSIFALIIASYSFLATAQENLGHQELPIDASLVNTIDSLKLVDQKWRGMIRQYNNNEIDTTQFNIDELASKMNQFDSLNYYNLKLIVDKFGFPGYDIVGQEGSNTFWLLIQHQDKNLGFQKEVLKLMKIQVDLKNASPWNYAYLIDRVNVNSRELQIYGTQMQLNGDKSSYEPKPVIEPNKLDERRASVGLNSIEEYINTMNERYIGNLKKE